MTHCTTRLSESVGLQARNKATILPWQHLEYVRSIIEHKLTCSHSREKWHHGAMQECNPCFHNLLQGIRSPCRLYKRTVTLILLLKKRTLATETSYRRMSAIDILSQFIVNELIRILAVVFNINDKLSSPLKNMTGKHFLLKMPRKNCRTRLTLSLYESKVNGACMICRNCSVPICC